MTISISDDTLHIDGFSTRDRSIISYFNNIPYSEWEGKLEMLLQLAILAKDSVGQTISIKHVEEAFDHLNEKMKRNIGEILGPQGDFAQSLEIHLGEGGKMQDMLDLNKTDSPLFKLQTAIQGEIRVMRDDINRQKGYREAARKGTQKGGEFEERCMEYLSGIAKHYSDIVEHTGEAKGEMTGSKKGDFVVSIDGTEKVLALEMKHYNTPLNLKEKKKALDQTMVNRGADYSVLVSRNRDALPKDVGWFNEYDGNKLVCALADTDDDDENVWVLETAYRWARLRVISDKTEQAGVDVVAIQEGMKKIQAGFKEMGKVKAKCQNIRKDADWIEDVMNNEMRKIQDEIDGVLHVLK